MIMATQVCFMQQVKAGQDLAITVCRNISTKIRPLSRDNHSVSVDYYF